MHRKSRVFTARGCGFPVLRVRIRRYANVMTNFRLIRLWVCLVLCGSGALALSAADFTVANPGNCANSWTVNGVGGNPTLTLVRGAPTPSQWGRAVSILSASAFRYSERCRPE